MNKKKCVLAIDQGTTSSRAIAFDENAEIVSVFQKEFSQIYPKKGWVEHDPEEIWNTTLKVCRQAIIEVERFGGDIVALGITNQRETAVIWDRDTGRPIYNAIVWQDSRTSDVCSEMRKVNLLGDVQSRTGLLIDPYFSATKVAWILDNVKGARTAAEKGKLAFGTIDSFIISRLTNLKVHATDATNAGRTNLFNIHKNQWDDELLKIFDVPRSVLPEVKDSSCFYGNTDSSLFGNSIPILGVIGDQQGALVGQSCFEEGDIKSTYGTGCFMLMNTGEKAKSSRHKLLTTIGYRIDGVTTYALEGAIFSAGSVTQWIRDEMKLVDSVDEIEALVQSRKGNGGVYMVPAFNGLGAPYWNPDVRGAIFGLTRDSGPADIVLAGLESVCYQTYDLIDSFSIEGVNPSAIRVDGGMTKNSWFLQRLSNILNLTIEKTAQVESTALGAAYLAGREAGVFGSFSEFKDLRSNVTNFEPEWDKAHVNALIDGWHDSVSRVLLK